MYIKCDNVEQLDEVRKYHNPTQDNISTMFINDILNISGSVGINILTKEYNFILNLEKNNIPYITFSQWRLSNTYKEIEIIMDKVENCTTRNQIETLEEELLESFKKRDRLLQLGFGTDMLSRFDKDKQKENSMSKKTPPMFQIRIINADKTNWYKNREVYIVTEEGDYYKYEDKYIDKNHCEVLYSNVKDKLNKMYTSHPKDKEIIRLHEQGLNISTISEKLSINYQYVEYIIEKVYETSDHFIQLEGGKLNVTKACELGLFVEDKPVFKWDKSYKEIQYKDYTICGTNEFIKIYKGCSKILVMVEPTPKKLRSEFTYYGIEVEVE